MSTDYLSLSEAIKKGEIMTEQSTAIQPMIDRIPTGLALAGEAANAAAARHVFSDYRARKAANTLRRQTADLDLLRTFLQTTGTPAGDLQNDPAAWHGMTWGLIAAWVKWMLNAGYAAASVNVRLSTVKVYAKLAAQVGTLTPEAYALIRTVSGYQRAEIKHIDDARTAADVPTRIGAKKADSVVLTASQVKALKDQPNTPQGRRDALIVCLAFDHGLRVGEIARLDVTAFNLTDGTFTFYRPKVDKVQTHHLTRSTLRAVRAYLDNDAPLSGRVLRASLKNGELAKTGMTERAITKRLNHLAAVIGVQDVSAHDGRHTWATRAARNNTDAFALQEAGGWNSLAMPSRYIEASKVANERVKLGDDD